MDSLHLDSMICGHHIYKNIWTPFICEIFSVEQEAYNTADFFTVAIVKDDTLVGYVFHKVSRLVLALHRAQWNLLQVWYKF